MKIAIGSDHAGYEDPPPHYKPAIAEYLTDRGQDVLDYGCFGPDAVDYPDIANRVTEAVLSGKADLGILLCGTGIGMSITANRHPGIRASVCITTQMARLTREHNHSNVLCLGRRIVSLKECYAIIDAWLEEPYSQAERHARRVKKMG